MQSCIGRTRSYLALPLPSTPNDLRRPMSHLLARLARTLTHHWKRSLLAAIVVLFLIGAAAGAGGEVADDFEVPGTESQQALDLFRAHSPAFAGADSTLVFAVDGGKVTDPGPKAAITGALEEVRELDGVEEVADPYAEGGTISRDGGLAAVTVRYSTEPQDLDKADGEKLLEAADTAEKDGVEVSARGILIDLASEQEAPVGELIGVGVAIILLTLLFRSLAAMAATLVGALLGVMVGQILLAALAKPLGLPTFAAVIAGMLGIGAAIAVGAVVVSALTVLPIMIGALKRWLRPRKPEHVRPSRAFERWGERVTARPWLSIAAGVLVLLVFAAPVTQLRPRQPDDRQ